MNPTILPELFKPSRDLRNLEKSELLGVQIFRNIRKTLNFTIFGPKFGILTIPRGQYIELDMGNPIFRSEMSNSGV